MGWFMRSRARTSGRLDRSETDRAWFGALVPIVIVTGGCSAAEQISSSHARSSDHDPAVPRMTTSGTMEVLA